METALGDTKYIFFLQLNEKLPDFYYKLAEAFLALDFTLVPIEPENLKEFSYLNRKSVLVIRHDVESQINFFKEKNKYIEYLLKHSKILMLDISSFREIPLVKKYRLHKHYKYYPLPMAFEEIAIRMAYWFYRDRKTKEKWPGGRRGRLPAMPG